MSDVTTALDAIEARAAEAPGTEYGDVHTDRAYLLALCRRLLAGDDQ